MSPSNFVPLATFVAIAGLSIWCWARVATKAGFSRAWGFAAIVPVLNIAVLCFLAFARWPALPDEIQQSEPAA
jgi:hypothetical protein